LKKNRSISRQCQENVHAIRKQVLVNSDELF
jgi:hypothetical protein